MGNSTDLEALFGAINRAKGQMAKESRTQDEVKTPEPQPDEDATPREYSVEAALQDIRKEQEARRQLLQQVDAEKGAEEKKKSEDKAREEEEQKRIRAAGEEAGRAKTNAIESTNARRRQQAQNRLAAARARKQAEKDAFEAAVAANVEAQRKAKQASKASSDAEEEQKRANEAKQKAEEEQRRANEAKQKAEDEAARAKQRADEAQKLADEANQEAQAASDEENNRRETIEKLEATIKNLESQVKSLAAENAALSEKNTTIDGEIPEDDSLEILDVVPATGTSVANYGNYTPVSDKDNTYGSAMKPITSFDAAIYLSNQYNRFHHKGSFSYYIVTQDGDKDIFHSESGNTDDAYEYAFLGALLMLQEVVKNGIKQVLIVVKDADTRNVLIQNAMNVRDNFGKTRSEYAKFMRKSNGIDFVASFAVVSGDIGEHHKKYFNLADAMAKTIVAK